MAEQGSLRRLGHDISALVDFFSRARHGDFDFNRVVEHPGGKLLDFGRHCRREHHRAAPLLRKVRHNGHDVVVKSHVKHAVGLVKNKKLNFRQVDITHLKVRQQTARSGDYHFDAVFKRLLLLCETGAVSAAVNSQRTYRQKIREALESRVNLDGKLARGRHDHALHLLRRLALAQLIDYGKKESRRLARARLSHGYKVAARQSRRNCLLLNRSAFLKIHIIESVKDVVGKVKFFKCHDWWIAAERKRRAQGVRVQNKCKYTDFRPILQFVPSRRRLF